MHTCRVDAWNLLIKELGQKNLHANIWSAVFLFACLTTHMTNQRIFDKPISASIVSKAKLLLNNEKSL